MAKPTSTHTAAPAKRKARITADKVRKAFAKAAPRLNPPCAEICAEIARLLTFVRETEDNQKKTKDKQKKTEDKQKDDSSPLAKDYDAAREAIGALLVALPKIIANYESEAGPNMRPAARLRDLLAAAKRVAANWPALDATRRKPQSNSKFGNVAERIWMLAAQAWQRANPGTRIGNPSTAEGRATAAIVALLALIGWHGVKEDAVAKAFARKITKLRPRD